MRREALDALCVASVQILPIGSGEASPQTASGGPKAAAKSANLFALLRDRC